MNKIDEILFNIWEKLKENKWSALGSIPCLLIILSLIVIFPMVSLVIAILMIFASSCISFIVFMIDFFD